MQKKATMLQYFTVVKLKIHPLQHQLVLQSWYNISNMKFISWNKTNLSL